MTDIQPATTSLILGNHPGLKNTLGMELESSADRSCYYPSENSGAYDRPETKSSLDYFKLKAAMATTGWMAAKRQ